MRQKVPMPNENNCYSTPNYTPKLYLTLEQSHKHSRANTTITIGEEIDLNAERLLLAYQIVNIASQTGER